MRRLPPSVPHLLANPALLTRASGIPKLRVLVKLKKSARNCSCWVSVIFVVLDKLTSICPIPSLRRILRPTFPVRWPGLHVFVPVTTTHGGNVLNSERHPAWINSSIDIFETSRFVFRLGRMALPTTPSMPPSTASGSLPFNGVNGEPLCRVRNELTCQPLRMCETRGCRPALGS